MPNHVTNIFHYVSDNEKFSKLAINEKREIDFSILVPIPDLLMITAGSSNRDVANFEYPEITEHTNIDNFIQSCVDNGQSVKNAMAHWNIAKYGYPDWYSFCNSKWGTKWNAYDVDIENKSFDTAWCAPDEWLIELAKHIDFVLFFADEDMGSNCGIIEAKNGRLYSILPNDGSEALAWACYVKYGDADCIDIDNYDECSKWREHAINAKENFLKYHDSMVSQIELSMN